MQRVSLLTFSLETEALKLDSLTYSQSNGDEGSAAELSPSYKKFAREPRSPLPPGRPVDWEMSQMQGYQATLVPPQAGGPREQSRERRLYSGDTAHAPVNNSDHCTDSVSPRHRDRGSDPMSQRQPALTDGLNRDALVSGQLLADWDRDPHVEDPVVTGQLLNLYFTHIATATYCLFPREPFTRWVETEKDKSPDDKMALYAILAMGSAFATDPTLKAVGKHFADIAGQALHSRFAKWSLQLCHARLMLGLYHFSRGRSQDSWDFAGMGLRAISALRLNTEKGVTDIPDDEDEDLDYGFSRSVLEECRRRTFWSGFLMDVSLRPPPTKQNPADFNSDTTAFAAAPSASSTSKTSSCGSPVPRRRTKGASRGGRGTSTGNSTTAPRRRRKPRAPWATSC